MALLYIGAITAGFIGLMLHLSMGDVPTLINTPIPQNTRPKNCILYLDYHFHPRSKDKLNLLCYSPPVILKRFRGIFTGWQCMGLMVHSYNASPLNVKSTETRQAQRLI
jgi:hypothetical protein